MYIIEYPFLVMFARIYRTDACGAYVLKTALPLMFNLVIGRFIWIQITIHINIQGKY